MNKDKPEYGDIWLDGYSRRIFVGDVYDLKNNSYAECITTDFFRPKVLKTMTIKFDTFQFLTYLGKSKANINDLFKTENEK